MLMHVLLLVFGALCLGPNMGVAAVNAKIGPEISARNSASTLDSTKEYQLKAAFLFNFARYTTWPEKSFEDKDSPIELIVIGTNPFGKTLEKIVKGKEAHKRSIRVQYVSSLKKDLKAHLVFVNGLKEAETNAVIDWYRKKPTMVVGNEQGFAQRGSCANFFIQKKRIKFEVNPDEVKKSGLDLSSQLLKLATIVETKERKK